MVFIDGKKNTSKTEIWRQFNDGDAVYIIQRLLDVSDPGNTVFNICKKFDASQAALEYMLKTCNIDFHSVEGMLHETHSKQRTGPEPMPQSSNRDCPRFSPRH